MPTLRIKTPEHGEIAHVLNVARITVGRRPDNTIQILDPSVSGRHAELVLEGDHYRLRDLGSTNLSFVDTTPVTDFHLHDRCKVTFGNIECEFDPATVADETPRLTPAQLEKDVAFLRAENQELLNKIDALQRRIDILSSARLITGKSETANLSAPDQMRKLVGERDELRYQMSGLKLEVDKLREELGATQRERDTARQLNELLHAEKASQHRESPRPDKGETQRIFLPMPQIMPTPARETPREPETPASASETDQIDLTGLKPSAVS